MGSDRLAQQERTPGQQTAITPTNNDVGRQTRTTLQYGPSAMLLGHDSLRCGVELRKAFYAIQAAPNETTVVTQLQHLTVMRYFEGLPCENQLGVLLTNFMKVCNGVDNAYSWFQTNMSWFGGDVVTDGISAELADLGLRAWNKTSEKRVVRRSAELEKLPYMTKPQAVALVDKVLLLPKTSLRASDPNKAIDGLEKVGLPTENARMAMKLYWGLFIQPKGGDVYERMNQLETYLARARKDGSVTRHAVDTVKREIDEYRSNNPDPTSTRGKELAKQQAEKRNEAELSEKPEAEREGEREGEGDALFEAAARACGWFVALGIAKGEMEALKGALEAAAKKDPGARAAAAVELAAGIIETIGHVLKRVAQNPELAEQAAEHLEIVGKVFGHFATVVKVINAIVVLSNPKASANARIDAVLEVVGCLGVVGFAIRESILMFQWVFNTIGVPIKTATEDGGLRAVFAGRSPTAVIADIEALPITPELANHTVYQLLWTQKFFKPVKSLFSQQVTSDAWMAYWKNNDLSGLGVYTRELAQVTADSHGMKDVPEDLRSKIADACKSVAIRFVHKQVDEAKQWS